MVQVSLTYTTKVTNTGIPHDVIVGCSLLDPITEEELYYLPWWVWWDVGSNYWVQVEISNITGDIPAGTYTAKARAWTDYEPGTKAGDLKLEDGTVVGIVYHSGTGKPLSPWLDEAVQTLVIGEEPGEVTARIDAFSITV